MATLRSAFSNGGSGWNSWRAALEPMARPDAARTIAALVLARVPGGAGESNAGLSAALR
jgi:hypothetical protein